MFYDFSAEELGIDPKTAAKIQEIKRLRPLSAKQPWGIFFVKFEPKKLPVVVLRRILSQVALKKRESANSANSALANIRHKRCVIMQEPGSNDQIQADVMKSLTGGDRISTRELNSSQIEFKPNAKFFMACNKIPSISDLDGGVIRRLKITEFVSRY